MTLRWQKQEAEDTPHERLRTNDYYVDNIALLANTPTQV